MRGKIIGIALGVLTLALCFSADAQQPAKSPRIGFVSGSGTPRIPRLQKRHSDKGCEILAMLREKISYLSFVTLRETATEFQTSWLNSYKLRSTCLSLEI